MLRRRDVTKRRAAPGIWERFGKNLLVRNRWSQGQEWSGPTSRTPRRRGESAETSRTAQVVGPTPQHARVSPISFRLFRSKCFSRPVGQLTGLDGPRDHPSPDRASYSDGHPTLARSQAMSRSAGRLQAIRSDWSGVRWRPRLLPQHAIVSRCEQLIRAITF